MELLEVGNGRVIEYLIEGPAGGRPLVMQHGTPGAAWCWSLLPRRPLGTGCASSRIAGPGIGGSTAQPGRRVADVAGDVAAVLDAVGADDFVTLGWSGGGPHALACAALLPDRCRAAAIMAGVAPYDADGLDWMAGMGEENIAEFGAAATGPEALDKFLAEAAPG